MGGVARRPTALVLALAASALGGCGLVLDLQPPEVKTDGAAGAMDAGVSPDGGARRDGGRDAGPGDAGVRADAGEDAGEIALDGGAVVDARVVDAGAADGGSVPCTSNAQCGPGFFCQRGERRCFGEGRCAPMPTDCPAVFDPVCGCDWSVYDNPCSAHRNGVGVRVRDGACPAGTAEGEWCDLAPTAPTTPGGCARCFDDRDCGGLFPFCVASSCVAGGEGICAGDPGGGYCHDQRFCRSTERCEGAVSDVCLPVQGRCVTR